MLLNALLAALAIDSTAALAASKAAAPGRATATTVVLVHGAFADGSSWDKVIPLLQSRGLKVLAVQNPLSSLADDVAFTNRVVDAQEGPVVLVGHSWGGTVITQAGGNAKVKALVYVAALAPAGAGCRRVLTRRAQGLSRGARPGPSDRDPGWISYTVC